MKIWPIAMLPFAAFGYHLFASGQVEERLSYGNAVHHCRVAAEEANLSRRQARTGCNCISRRAKRWKERNPAAEYTRAVHERYFEACMGTYLNPGKYAPKPAKAKKVEPSDWGAGEPAGYAGSHWGS